MTVSPNSFRDYVASSSQTVFPIVIDRISNEHLRVFKDGAVLTLTTDYTVSGANVTLVVPADAGDKVRIQRDTPQLTRSVDFMAEANITETDLDNSALHNLYLAQECWDQVLQLRDTPVVIVAWASTNPLPDLSPNATWDEQAASRMTPSIHEEVSAGQQWIRIDATTKVVILSPGKYRIDMHATAEEQTGGLSRLSIGMGNSQDGAGSVIIHSLADNQALDSVGWLNGSHIGDVSAETELTFKAGMVVAGGQIELKGPTEWVITRLGGDPELN